jgi:LysR family glycine cleavage system transcriptional activator
MKTPSINALRAFEAAARLQSFSHAADELCVTHGAISHQIRGLERQTGDKLFQRKKRKMLLTPVGAILVHRVRQSLLTIDEIFSSQDSADSARTIVVSTLASFANHWLAPRLSSFREAHPNINLQLLIEMRFADFSAAAANAGIRYGAGGWTGLHEIRLFDDYLVPVCSVDLAKRLNLSEAADLLTAPLITNARQPWSTWLLGVGLPPTEPASVFSVDDAGVALTAARHGAGIALSRFSLVSQDLKLGRLAAPIRARVKDPYGYYLVHQPTLVNQELLVALAEWLSAEGMIMLRDIDEIFDA